MNFQNTHWTYVQGEIFRKALEMKDKLPNDQEFGRQFRSFLQQYQDGKILQPVSTIEFDEKISHPDVVEITKQHNMSIRNPYVVREGNLFMARPEAIRTNEIYAYVQRGPESPNSGIPDIIITKYKKVDGGATEVGRIVKSNDHFNPDAIKKFLEEELTDIEDDYPLLSNDTDS